MPLAERFTIARGAAGRRRGRPRRRRARGRVGWGEAAPIDRYDESAASALAFVEARAELGDDPFALDEIEGAAPAPGEHAAKAAIDAALHDLCGKLAGVPVWRLLGHRRAGPPTSWTIPLDDPDAMARKAERTGAPFQRLKLKLGGGDGLDVERVRAVRGVAGCRCRSTSTSGGRSTRRSRRCRSSPGSASSTASSRCPPATPTGRS